MIVYVITCDNGKRYVGITRDLEKRLRSHTKTDSYIGRAMRKHSYSVQIVMEGTIEECFAEEVRLIAELRTKWPAGYNLTDGGEGVVGETDEVRQARSRAMKRIMCAPDRKAKARGAVWTPEMRMRKAEQARLQMSDPATRAANSARATERLKKKWLDPDYRKLMSEKAKLQWKRGGFSHS